MSNQIISIDRFEQSPTEPLTLAQVKNHLIVSTSSDDTLITSMLTQVRQAIENFCHISIVRQRIETVLVYDHENELPYGPVTDITEVSVSTGATGSGPIMYESDDKWQTDGGQFKTFIGSSGIRYRLVYWAGYVTVPELLRLAILNEMAFRYEKRGEVTDPGICEAARVLAMPFKRMLWF